MSWSFNVIGEVDKFTQFLEDESNRLTGQSKEEFDSAKPHLAALVTMNVSTDYKQLVHVIASGHASKDKDGNVKYSSCCVDIKGLNGRLL